jgi:hypothetical protein
MLGNDTECDVSPGAGVTLTQMAAYRWTVEKRARSLSLTGQDSPFPSLLGQRMRGPCMLGHAWEVPGVL